MLPGAPPVVAQVEHQHVLGILQLSGTLSQIIAAQVLGDESWHHPQPWDGSPIPQLPPPPPQGPRGIFGTTLQMLFSPTCVLKGQKGAGPEARAEALAGGRGSTETQHLPAPRGPPAGRCHRGLLSSSGCLHVPRLPSKWTERNDCSHHLAPAPAEPLRRTETTLVWSRDAWGQHPRCMGCSMGHSPGGRAGWTAHRGAW